MKNYIYKFISFLVEFIIVSLLYIVSMFISKNKKKIIFGTTPIISNKYWANALKEIGYDAETFMESYYSSINKQKDFDKYYYDLLPSIFKNKYINNHIKNFISMFFALFYVIKNAKIVVIPFHGMILKKYCWRFELFLLKLNGIKVIVFPYGADAYMYSRIRDKSAQNVLLNSYPMHAKHEKDIEKKVFFYSKHADIIITGFMSVDGMPRWDVTICQFVHIDTSLWKKKIFYSMNDGYNGKVKILHTPNHREFKGTEFILNAIEELKKEGLNIELILLEKTPNDKVREIMQEVDILVEQVIYPGYALNAIEGMASGLPVIANLENKTYTEIFRRYSFLNECPILSSNPETLKENLKILITNPKLRKDLGSLGRRYVEKYHSFRTTQYLFTKIIEKLDGKNIDLMNLFHPLKSEYVRNNYIKTPLKNNKLYTYKDKEIYK